MTDENRNLDQDKMSPPEIIDRQLPRRDFLLKSGGVLAGLSIAVWGVPGVNSTKVSRVWAGDPSAGGNLTGQPQAATPSSSS